MKIGICDDNIEELNNIREICHNMGYTNTISFSCGKDLLEYKGPSLDLLFLDIEMGEYYKGGARAQVVQKVEKQLFELYKNPELKVKPKELEQRGGAYYSDAACEVINAIYNDKQAEHYVNIPHHGHIDNIPADWAVEMTCKLGRDGATPHPRITHFDDKVMGLIPTIKGFEIAASNAALSGEFNDVLLALNLSPLVHSDRDAELLAREMILAHEKWLPNFADCIAELKKAH